ncbi:MAG: universal stress protein, partial [Chloroflexota bacterium]|nr:universal stress protein [Chloroflexota bacterium]
EQDVAVSVAAHTGELQADLVALCTHGRGDFRRAVSGSIAQQVLRKVDIPVLLVRPQMQSPTKLNTVMLPLDGTPGAEVALALASEISRHCASRLRLVGVVPTVGTLRGDRSASARLTPMSSAVALDTEEEDTLGYLQRAVEELGSRGIEADMVVRRGDTVQMLADEAQKSNAGLTVIATHGTAGIGAIWAGSIASGLINRLDHPLLLVKRDPADRTE